MFWSNAAPPRVHPTLNSLRYTNSHAQRQHDEQYEEQKRWRVIGSIVALIVFITLLVFSVIGIPIVVTETKKSPVCVVPSSIQTRPPMPPTGLPTINTTFPEDGTGRLCAGNASWNAMGVTVAGQANGAPSSSLTGLRFPRDLYVFGNGTLLIPDYGNDRIIRKDPNSTAGTIVAGTGSYGSWKTLLATPGALTVSGDHLFVSDLENYRIQVFPLNSNSSPPEGLTLIGRYGQGSDLNQFNYAVSLIAPRLPSPLLYISDYRNHRVLLWDAESNDMRLIAGRTGSFGVDDTRLYYPIGIALDPRANALYIADQMNNRIQRYNLTEPVSSSTVAGWSLLNNPAAVQLDPSGEYMFIADKLNHRIVLWRKGDIQGRTIAGTGVAGIDATQLNAPYQIRFDMNYNLYVVDTNNCRIQRFDLIFNGC